MNEPRVIGCGHLHVRSKADNEFPAFLVRLAHEDKCYYLWRTKRDFLLLNRSLQRHDDKATPFPKSAYAKLCNHALNEGPWVRPSDDEAPDDAYLDAINCTLRDKGIDDIDSTTCNFDPKMKLSVAKMDWFLEACSAAAKMQSPIDERVASTTENGDTESQSAVTFADAWSIFCRPEDADNLVVPRSIHNKRESIGNAATLGQYFASNENARDVVNSAMELLSNTGTTDDDIIFLEPSCGDGRIIDTLLQSTKNMKRRYRILGVDIDSSAIQKAAQKLNRSEVVLKCTNFLSLDRRQFSDLVHYPAVPERCQRLVVIGGPPYTPKHLPGEFITHSILELGADVVVFILPDRCAREAPKIQEVVNSGNRGFFSYSNSKLDNISFSFKETNVQQPSILQSWYRQSPESS